MLRFQRATERVIIKKPTLTHWAKIYCTFGAKLVSIFQKNEMSDYCKIAFFFVILRSFFRQKIVIQ